MITEDQLEQLCLDWFQDCGFKYAYGPDIAYDGESPERRDYRQVVLTGLLLESIKLINPQTALEEAAHSVAKPDHHSLIQNNRAFHRLLTDGVKVQFNKDDEMKTDHVQLIDFQNPDNDQIPTKPDIRRC